MRENRTHGSMGGGWKRAIIRTAPAAYPVAEMLRLAQLALEPVDLEGVVRVEYDAGVFQG